MLRVSFKLNRVTCLCRLAEIILPSSLPNLHYFLSCCLLTHALNFAQKYLLLSQGNCDRGEEDWANGTRGRKFHFIAAA